MRNAYAGARRLAAAIALVGLGACSGLLPPIPVTDLYGVDGARVDLTHAGSGAASAALGPSVTSFQGSFETQFDAEGIDLPGFVSAIELQESVTIAANVELTVPGEDAVSHLDGFTVVGGRVALRFYVDAGLIGTAGGLASFSPGLAVSRQSCAFDGFDTRCTYLATVDPSEQGIVVVASAASAKAVFDAMTAGETLEVEGTFDVTLEAPGLTSSAIVRVALATSGGSIRF